MNKLTLDYADNDELKVALQGKEPGTRVTLTVELMVIDAGDTRFEGDIESISTESNDEDSEDSDVDEAIPDGEEPLMIVISKEKKRKSKPSKDKGESETDESDDEDDSDVSY